MNPRQQRRAVKLLKDARLTLVQDLNQMDEEEQSQPGPKANGRLVDAIDRFIESLKGGDRS